MTQSESCRYYLLVYSVLALLAYVLDAIEFIIQFRYFGEPGHEHQEILLMFAAIYYLCLNFYYLVWIS